LTSTGNRATSSVRACRRRPSVRRIAADLDALTLLQGVSELDLAEPFACLRAFYRGAAAHGPAVVLWWD
jgi:hypothetical protein